MQREKRIKSNYLSICLKKVAYVIIIDGATKKCFLHVWHYCLKEDRHIFKCRNTYITVIYTYKFHSENRQLQNEKYRMRAIIILGLYIFNPIFQCSLYSRAVNITDNLCTKQGNPGLKAIKSGFKSEWVIIACLWYTVCQNEQKE